MFIQSCSTISKQPYFYIEHQRNDVMMTAINIPITPMASLAPQSTATINYAIGRSGMYCAHLCRCDLIYSLWISVWSISVGDFSSCVCGVCDCLHKHQAQRYTECVLALHEIMFHHDIEQII